MGLFTAQMKQVFRRLRKAPMFTFIAILTLALGIGANTAIFSVLEGVLLKPLPYPEPERLIGLWEAAPGIAIKKLNVSPSQFFTFQEENRTFENFGFYTGDRVSVTGVAEPEQVRALDVTSGLLPTLGTQAMLGRVFSAHDDLPSAAETVVLSYGYWQRRLSGDRGVIGRRLLIDGKAKEIIGVLPRDFRFMDMDAELLLPFQFDRSKTYLGNFSYEGVARLKPGVTVAQAEADGARMWQITLRSFQPPAGFSAKLFEQAHLIPAYIPFKEDLTGDVGPTLWVLMGTIGVVLLIACANVANLLLVRVETRHLELTIRAALGASTPRIAGELLLESLTVAVLGGVCGLAVAYGALKILVAIGPVGLPRISEIGIDGSVLLFAVGVSLFTGLLFGSVPVMKYAGARLASGIREGSRSLSVSRERHFARNTLVVVQVALALVLLICAGLMIRTFRALTQVDPGFKNAAQVQTFSIYIPEAQVAEPAKVLRMEEEMRDELKRIPGVSEVAMTTAVPMGGNESNDLLFAHDRTYREGELPPIRRFVSVSPGIHKTLGTRLLAGREFTWDDIDHRRLVTVISAAFAKDYWGSPAKAMHKQIREGMKDEWREIVGVVDDVHFDGVEKAAPATAYFPIAMTNFQGDTDMVRRSPSFVIRSSRAGSESFLKEVRQAIWSIDANLPLAQVQTLDQMYRKSMARTSFTLVLLTISAGMALVLGGIGLYGVIAYSVSQRTREIGVRMALGAQQGEVTGMFVRHGVVLACIGAAFGLAAASVVMLLLSSLLFGVSTVDALTYLSMLAVLLVIAAAASYLPARRAAGVDPSAALRGD